MEDYIFEKIQHDSYNYMDQNDSDYSATSNPDYKRQELKDKLFQQNQDTNWQAESDYHNSYRVNRKNIKCRTLKKNDR